MAAAFEQFLKGAGIWAGIAGLCVCGSCSTGMQPANTAVSGRVRDRMEQAVSGADTDSVARRLLDGRQKNATAKPTKRQGLDDGVKL